MTALLGVAWAVVAVLLLVPPAAGRRLLDLDRGETHGRGWGSHGFWLTMASLVAVLAAGTVLGVRAGGWALLAAMLGVTGLRLGGQRLAERRRARSRAQVAVAAHVVAAQLRVGAIPRRALEVAARDCAAVERAAATLAIGGDVGRALVHAGEQPGQEGLASLGRAWRLSEGSGAPIADLASRVSDQIRMEQATRELVAAELAAPRASGRLLACLPLLGIVLGRMSGGDPIGFLTGNLIGLACLVSGVGLACGGVLWSEHLAQAAEEG